MHIDIAQMSRPTLEVYEAGPQLEGALGPAEPGWRDPHGDGCWGQRATNEAMGLGAGQHVLFPQGFLPPKAVAKIEFERGCKILPHAEQRADHSHLKRWIFGAFACTH